MSNFDKLRDKVAKLLRQAEDVAGTPEEGVFQAKAFELMAKYGIDQASVDAAKQGLDVSDLREAIKWSVPIVGAYGAAQMQLLHNIALALHCKTVYSKSGAGLVMFVYGVPSHIERVQMLWQILQPQMMRLVKSIKPDYEYRQPRLRYNYETHEFETYLSTGSGYLKSYRRSWIAGFGSAVGQRLREQENKALQEAESSGALVLFRGDAEKAALALRAAHPRLGRGTKSRTNYDGYAHGQRDGRNATFNQAIGG